ncbi:MAG: hypothetical protein JAY90_15580 [Candidatus Thiodiazotropha lotti]|nr:hypothetical protein [Candidatus Thiodiazotropha lotti]
MEAAKLNTIIIISVLMSFAWQRRKMRDTCLEIITPFPLQNQTKDKCEFTPIEIAAMQVACFKPKT